MKRGTFRQQSLEEVKEKQAIKMARLALKPKKAITQTKLNTATGKKTSNKVPSKNKTKKLKAELWELCKQITRKKYQNQNGTWHCFTCGKLIDLPAKAQTGHGIPSSVGGILLRYHLNNLRIQDYFCNINLGGNGGEYYKRLVLEIGQEKVDELYALKLQSAKADVLFFEEKIKEYTHVLSEM